MRTRAAHFIKGCGRRDGIYRQCQKLGSLCAFYGPRNQHTSWLLEGGGSKHGNGGTSLPSPLWP